MRPGKHSGHQAVESSSESLSGVAAAPDVSQLLRLPAEAGPGVWGDPHGHCGREDAEQHQGQSPHLPGTLTSSNIFPPKGL